MSALRTQVYFTVDQGRRLDARAQAEGKTLAEVVRDAVDRHVGDLHDDLERQHELDQVYGACPDFGSQVPSRDEWDRVGG